MTIQHPKEQSHNHHHHHQRRLWQRIVLTTSLLSAAAASASSSSSKGSNTNKSSSRTSQHNLHRPTQHPHHHRSLAVNPNLINYSPHGGHSSSATTAEINGYTQTELSKISQQTYGAPHTWTQCPKSYTGYRASYNCKSYIYCSNGKMKEEGYVGCQEGLIFDNLGGMCVWEDEVGCHPDAALDGDGDSSDDSSDEGGATTVQTTDNGSSTTTNSDDGSNTYSKKMKSVTQNPRFSGPTVTTTTSESSLSSSYYQDWGGYWHNGKWIDDTDGTALSNNNNDEEEGGGGGVWDNVEILSWSKEDVTNFPLPQLQPYDLAQQQQQHTTTTTITTSETLPRDFISQEGWSSTSRSTKKVIGYYTNWQWYSNQERPAPVNMQFTKVDRVNFAFFQMSEGGEVWGTDTWADGGILFGPRNWNVEVPEDTGYAPQFNDNNGFNDKQGAEWNYVGDKYVHIGENIYCHRNTPSGPRDCNGHFYDKGLIGRAHSQGAEVYISIGGWSSSSVFPVLAASGQARRTFAKNCVGLIREYGVDGIDIVWEFPGYTPNGGTADDAKNFVLLLKDVRSALDAYQQVAFPNNDKTFGLTAALPCVPEMIAYQDIAGLNEVLTELSLKTFDFHGAWNDKVGVNSPLFDQPFEKFESAGMSVHGCTERWVQGGADKSKINIGVPFYGRTYLGADRLYGPHGGADTGHWKEHGGAPQYHEILDNLLEMISLRDDGTKTQYAYFAEDRGLVSFDDNQSICDKVEYSIENEYHGLSVWDLSGDLTETYSTPLLDMINLKLDNGIKLDCELFRAETRDKNGEVVAPPDVKPNLWYANWIVGACLNDGMQSIYTQEEHLYRRKEECCAYKFENDFEDCVKIASAEEESREESNRMSSPEETTTEEVKTPNVLAPDMTPDMFTQSSATRSTLAAESEPPKTWCQGGCKVDGQQCVGNQNHPQTIDDAECKKCSLGQTFWPCDVDGLCFCWDPSTPRIPPAPSSGKAQLSNERPCDYFSEEKFNQLAPTAQHPYTYQGLCDAIDDYNDGHAEKAFMMGTEEERKSEFAAFLGHTLHESDEWRAGREYLICADNKIVDGEVYCKPCDSESFDWETFKCNGVGLVGDGLTYNGYCNYVIEPPLACACEELQSEPAPLDGYIPANKVFFGRGAIQTSWNYNYRSASDALTGDSSTFCENPDLIATTPKYAWGAGVFFWMENLKEETTCHIEALKNHDFGGTLNNINGGLECPAYHGGWHGEAIKLRINRYCKSSRALGLESILTFDGCKGLADSFAECLGDGTCQECKHFSNGVPPPTKTDPVEVETDPMVVLATTQEVVTPNPTPPPVAEPTPPPVSEEVTSQTASSCPSGLQHLDGYENCCVPETAYHGDGACDPDAPYNTEECGYDGGDCCKGSCKLDSTYGCGAESFGYGPFGYFCQDPEYADEFIDSDECTVSDKTRVGDGRCDAGIEVYNTAACNWDGGDCCEQTCDERYAHFDCGDPAYPFDCQNPDLDTVATTTTTTATTTSTTTTSTTTTTTTAASTTASTTTTTKASGSTAASSTATFVVEVTDDASISKSYPDANFGLDTSFMVKGLSSGPNAIDSIMKFTIPPSDGASSASAVLRVFSLVDAASGGIFHLAPDPTWDDWQESSVTWNTAPDWEDRIINIGAVAKDQWYTVDISEAITSMYGAGGQLTIRIRSRDPGVASYSSLQGTHPPQILMAYGSTDVIANADPITTASIAASSQLPPDSKVYFPSDDASIVQDQPDENYGLETELRIDQDTGVFDVLIRFDTSNMNINSVSSATLRLYCIDGSTSGGIFTTSTPNWDEESVTWSNAPTSYDIEVLGSLGNVYAGEWYELDISKVFANPPNSLTKALSIRISSESWNRAIYSSKEGSNPPQLLLQFSEDQSNTQTPTSQCEEDVKICPDGSFLPRVASINCEFEACPQYDPSSGSGLYYPIWGPGGSITCVDSTPPTWALGAYLKNSRRECCKTYSSLNVAKCLRT